MSNQFTLSLVPARPALLSARENIVDVLLRLQAPDPPASISDRPMLNLSIVIDRSASMRGRPLLEAKRSASVMIDSLTPKDRVSIVAYDDTVQVMAPSQQVDNKGRLKAAVALIQTAGSTNLHGGWLKGAEEAAAHLTPGSVSRVLMLSDGCANKGIIDTEAIAAQCAELGNVGVSTSTYGLGNAFNEDLMTAMAHSGRGNSYYSDRAETLLERFQEEFSLLSSLCARDVQLQLSLSPGVRCEMLNLYQAAGDGWRLPDLAYDGEAWAALRFTVDAEAIPAIGATHTLCEASVTCRNIDDHSIHIPASRLSLPVLSPEMYSAQALDQNVIRRVTEAEAAKLQDKAAIAARHEDWTEVERLLFQVRAMAVHSPWLSAVVAHLERLAAQRDMLRFCKEALFGALGSSARLRSKREDEPGYQPSSSPAHLQQRVIQGGSGLDTTKVRN
jgi:Ca-activated chloride channel family protein